MSETEDSHVAILLCGAAPKGRRSDGWNGAFPESCESESVWMALTVRRS